MDCHPQTRSSVVKTRLQTTHENNWTLITRGHATASEAAFRVPAADLETLVEARICALLKDSATILDAAGPAPIAVRKALVAQSADLERRWPTLMASKKRTILLSLVARIDVGPDKVEIAICPAMLRQLSKPDLGPYSAPPTGPIKILAVPARVRRTGMEIKLLVENAALDHREPDRSLLRPLGQARRFSDMVAKNASIAELAATAGVCHSYFTRVFRLSFLAPQITTAILQDRQPPELTANKLMQSGALSPFWPDQHRRLGFK